MSKINEKEILTALANVRGPDKDSDIVELGLVSPIHINGSSVYVSIEIDPKRAEELEPMRLAAQKVVSEVAGVSQAIISFTAHTAGGQGMRAEPSSQKTPSNSASNARSPSPEPQKGRPEPDNKIGVPGIGAIIAVASGKGGVGKSTTAANLALGLQANGQRVGILDADIYGPSLPRLMGISGKPEPIAGRILPPMEGYGLKTMSMGYLVDEDTPMIWRGPMVISALTQMLREVQWGKLDVLVVDMPPGTGDAQLTMAQQVPLAGAVIVSTPQDLALIDARKGINMFRKVDVPILGIVENMSYFLCPSCGDRSDIFGHGGAREEAERLGVPFLGEVPLNMSIRETSDGGKPIVASDPESAHAMIYKDIAKKTWGEIGRAKNMQAMASPTIILE